MTRILATGDWHAGVSALDLADQEKVWHRIVDVALDNDVDLFLHGGDVFEGPVVTPEQMRAVLNPLSRLHYSQIPVIVLLGNGRHDLATRTVHGLDVLTEIPGIKVSDRPENIQEAGCVVTTLPWTKRARDEDTATQLVEIARDLHEHVHGLPNVLLAHWSISSGALPNGLPLTELREPVLEWADLDAIGFDLIVGAHIHKSQRLDDPQLGDATLGLYVGSPQPLSHGEAGYSHGVWLVDVEAGAVSLDFIEIEAPQFVTIDLNHENLEVLAVNGHETVLGMWAVKDDSIVRVHYTATREQDATIDKDAIRRELLAAGASKVTIEPQITREVRARVETLTQDLGPMEAMLLYCKAQNIEPLTAERMGERLKAWIG